MSLQGTASTRSAPRSCAAPATRHVTYCQIRQPAMAVIPCRCSHAISVPPTSRSCAVVAVRVSRSRIPAKVVGMAISGTRSDNVACASKDPAAGCPRRQESSLVLRNFRRKVLTVGKRRHARHVAFGLPKKAMHRGMSHAGASSRRRRHHARQKLQHLMMSAAGRDAADGMGRRAVSRNGQSWQFVAHGELAPETIPDICHEPLGRGHPDGTVIAEVTAWQQQGLAGKADDRNAGRPGPETGRDRPSGDTSRMAP